MNVDHVLMRKSNQIVTDQKEIMNALHNYYERLFGNRDAELEHKNIEDLLQTDQIPKLTDFQKESIEGKLTITEIGNALKKMKNDKSPGLDGFNSEFFKFFWSKLKYFILRCLNQSFQNGMLLQTLRTCVITCHI